MTPAQIIQILSQQFGDRILAAFPEDKHPRIHVDGTYWRPIAEFLVSHPPLRFDWLANHSAVDYPADGKMAVVHDLWSYDLHHRFAVKVFCPRDNPRLPTVSDLWRIADWHEREAFDLMGITFEGHPDLRRILLAEDWVGHPLRKDYQFPTEYHGIPNTPSASQNEPEVQ
jgi:NADH-quinone oxidoreductase subunit C